MAQHDYVIANGTGAAVRSDLNNALAAIVSNNSGASEPTTTYAYMWWPDTTSGNLKLRNGANNAWISLRELDGTLTIEDGTAGAPGLAFADDLNTGVFSPGADQVAFTAGGTARLTATTTAVTSALPVDVPLGSASAPTVTFTGDLNTGIYSPGADQVAVATNGTQRLTVDTAATTSTLPVVHPLGAVGTPSITFTGDLNTGLWSPTADTIAASTGGSERLRIDSTGRVGIGTTAPTDALQVVSGSNYVASFNTSTIPSSSSAISIGGYLNSGSGGSGGAIRVYHNHGATNASAMAFEVNGATEVARIDSGGRLLVGTSSKSATASTTAKGVIGLGGGGSFICAEGQVANNGTIDITVSTGGLHYFTGLLQVNNINTSNGSHSTQSLISVLGSSQLGTITTSTLHTANGGGGQSFTITYVAMGILRFTNTSGSTCNVQISYMGGGTNAS